jgi:hypothetical protein
MLSFENCEYILSLKFFINLHIIASLHFLLYRFCALRFYLEIYIVQSVVFLRFTVLFGPCDFEHTINKNKMKKYTRYNNNDLHGLKTTVELNKY